MFSVQFSLRGTEEVQNLKRENIFVLPQLLRGYICRSFQLLNIRIKFNENSSVDWNNNGERETRTSNIMATLNGVFSL
jgi:hypothetical protein